MANSNREVIKLTYEQHRDLCQEGYYMQGDAVVRFKDVPGSKEHEGSSRHAENWTKVIQRVLDNKYFFIGWSDSVKDSMGWRECNEYGEHSIEEVFPEVITTTVYK